jgi:hypothetical protein
MSDLGPQSAAIDPQSSATGAKAPTKRARTAADRKRKDNYSRPIRWAGITLRDEVGEFIANTRADLIKQIGGAPSPAQRMLIERAVMLSVPVARFDARLLAGEEISEHAVRQHLAWSNSLTRTLKLLGIKAAPKPARTVFDIDWSTARREREAAA